MMLMRKARSWFTGYNPNVAGHEYGNPRYLVYNGGAPKYVRRIDQVASDGYTGVEMDGVASDAQPRRNEARDTVAVDKSDWVAGKTAKQAAQRGEAPFMQFEDGRMHTYGEAHSLQPGGQRFRGGRCRLRRECRRHDEQLPRISLDLIGLGRIGAFR